MSLLYQTRRSDFRSPLGGLFQGMAAGDEQRQKMMQHLSEQNAAQASSLLEQQKLKSNKFNELYDDLFKIKSPGGAQIMQKRFDEAGIEMDVKAWWKDTDAAYAFAQRDTTRAQEQAETELGLETDRQILADKRADAQTAAEQKILDAEKRDADAKAAELKTIDSRQKFFISIMKTAYNKSGVSLYTVPGVDDAGDPKLNEAIDIGLTKIAQGWSVQKTIDFLRVTRRDLYPTNASGAVGGEGIQENPKGSSPQPSKPKLKTKIKNGVKYEKRPDGYWYPVPIDPNDGFGERSQSYEDTIGEVEGLPFKPMPIPDPAEGRIKLGLDNYRRAGGA